ncbi:ribosomal protein L11 methyltransferase [Advenella kashmirensis W13003]|uniref:Ribosomal protein L11 methyltransferase n=1 Tax=Advenella kashmirensis W13003 TaxID=1424334 RepID=V8QP04_9BURK|nr:50S ribosomal protein L11 methyltransferase [Advenella kashmirensis]ETF01030.1 ribosomal protein L11 methyltransferase [Advenella kashmirensis W13003]
MRELVLSCSEERAEALSDILLELGVLSVSVEDADSGTERETPLFGEPGGEPDVQAWHRNRVVALLPDDLALDELLDALLQQTGEDYSDLAAVREVVDTDWVRLTQSQFDPISITDRIWIVPSWHRENPEVPSAETDQNLILIELDPGLAFGTGSHPTTHLCAQWLAEHLQQGQTVLDYGCGSGILAIIAAKLGARGVVGVDIDDQAVQSTDYNAQNNGVELTASLPDGLQPGTFDVVVANILSNPLKVLAPMLCGRVAPGGRLILSGVLERQAQEVAAAYAPWIDMSVWRSHEGWVCLAGTRKQA